MFCISADEKIASHNTILVLHSYNSAMRHVIDPYPAKLIYLNFQPLEVVSRYRDPQPQAVENYSYFVFV